MNPLIEQSLLPEPEKKQLQELFQSKGFRVLCDYLSNKEAEAVVLAGQFATSDEEHEREDDTHIRMARDFRVARMTLTTMAADDFKFQLATFKHAPITPPIPTET